MNRRPRGRGQHLFDRRSVVFAIVLGVAAVIGPFTIVGLAPLSGAADAEVRTLGFVALIVGGALPVMAVALLGPRAVGRDAPAAT